MRINPRILPLILLLSLTNLIYPNSISGQEKVNPKQIEELNNSEITLSQAFTLPEINDKKPRKTLWLTMTAYSSTVDQTDSSPFITASGERVRDGIVAYNHLPMGTYVKFPEHFGDKVFVVKDRLKAGTGVYVVDRWVETRDEAKNWGAKVVKMEVL